MANTPVLNLEDQAVAAAPTHYTRDLEEDRVDNANARKLDVWSGNISGSFSSQLKLSGSAAEQLDDGALIGAEYTTFDRVIKEVVCWAHKSGSGGVSRIDVQVQQGPAGNFSTVFSNNAFKPALSSSLGNFGIARAVTFVSGSNMLWPAGTLVKAVFDTVAGAGGLSGQKGVTVDIRWVPSGSYGTGV